MLTRATAPISPPTEQLAAVVRSRKTGQFVFAAKDTEIHVYLQHGRVAWATDSRRPLEFMRRLMQRQHIDKESIRHVIESCRKERRPLGETLIEWGLASLEDVRDALYEQLSLSVTALSQEREGSSIFLERPQFQSYDERLTFELTALITQLSEPSTDGSPRLDPTRVASAARAASWLSVGTFSCPKEPRAPLALHSLLTKGVDLVARRSPSGGTLGFVTADESLVFAGYDIDGDYGRLYVSLAPFILPAPTLARAASAAHPLVEGFSRGEIVAPAVVERLREVLHFGPSILAVALLDGSGEPLFSLDRSGAPGEWLAWIAARPELLALLESPATRVGVASRSHWIFGVALHGEESCSAWVLLERSARQGLGWAALTSALGGSLKP